MVEKVKQDSQSQDSHDESYFASFTDMLVGVIFIFIILLMIVAHNYQKATESVTQMSKEIENTRNAARDQERDAQRDQIRDAQRDQARDAERDAQRDIARDAEHDQIIAQNQPIISPPEPTAIIQEIAKNQNDPNSLVNKTTAKETTKNDDTVKELKMAQQNIFNESRSKILEQIQTTMTMQGFHVNTDSAKGTLSIPESMLFDTNHRELSPRGKQTINALAGNLKRYLPCIAPANSNARGVECNNMGITANDGLDAIFIDDYPSVNGTKEDKLLFAVQHIVAVFNALKSAEPYLDRDLRNNAGVPILNIKVNQSRREAKNRDAKKAEVKDSVVFRFVMRQPNPQDIQKLQNAR